MLVKKIYYIVFFIIYLPISQNEVNAGIAISEVFARANEKAEKHNLLALLFPFTVFKEGKAISFFTNYVVMSELEENNTVTVHHGGQGFWAEMSLDPTSLSYFLKENPTKEGRSTYQHERVVTVPFSLVPARCLDDVERPLHFTAFSFDDMASVSLEDYPFKDTYQPPTAGKEGSQDRRCYPTDSHLYCATERLSKDDVSVVAQAISDHVNKVLKENLEEHLAKPGITIKDISSKIYDAFKGDQFESVNIDDIRPPKYNSYREPKVHQKN